VKDLARVELGAQDYSIVSRLNGKPAAIVVVYQLPGSNAVRTAAGVRKLMAEMKRASRKTWITSYRLTRQAL